MQVHVGIIARFSYQSLMNHVGDGEEWGLELGEGGLEFLTPYASSVNHSYRGKLESLSSNMDFLEFCDDDYVVMIDSTVLSNVDLIQKQYTPMPVEEQIAILYCGIHGLLTDVPVEKVSEFQDNFLQVMRSKHRANVLEQLLAGNLSKEVTDVIEEEAKGISSQYK